MGSLTFSEIVTIALVILIVFGPNRLPELSRKIGQFLAWGRQSMQDFTNQINAEFGDQTQPLADLRKDVEGIRADLKGAVDAVSKPLSTPLAPDETPDSRLQTPESDQQADEDGVRRTDDVQPSDDSDTSSPDDALTEGTSGDGTQNTEGGA